MLYWSAITLGFVSSLHCIGMCGPLVLILPQKNSFLHGLMGGLEYNFGRIITYALLGLFFGFIGKGFLMADVQQSVAITLGVLLVIASLFGINIEKHLNKWSFMASITSFIRRQFQRLLSRQHRHFFFGLLNGILPCGMVYLALAGAVTTPSAIDGGFFMLSFGLGTLPAMILPFFVGNGLKQKLGPRLAIIQSVAMLLVGLLLISRGLGVEFPAEFKLLGNAQKPCYVSLVDQ